jgi:thymidylate kinase
MFIVLEGMDACGKDTQGALLVERFGKKGVNAKEFSFPSTETELGKAIARHLTGETFLSCIDSIPFDPGPPFATSGLVSPHPDDPLVFQCMMIADRCEALREITETLQTGLPLIAKRWWPSGYVYGAAEGLSPAWLHKVYWHLPKPDLYILFDLDVETAIKRRPDRRDRYESNLNYQKKISDGYRELWAQGNPIYWRVIDGRLPIEEVHALIWREVHIAMDNEF